MGNEYKFLVEKEEIWAKMLMDVLKNNGIPCAARSVHGAGFVVRTGKIERLKIYVPEESYQEANELMEELFSEEAIK